MELEQTWLQTIDGKFVGVVYGETQRRAAEAQHGSRVRFVPMEMAVAGAALYEASAQLLGSMDEDEMERFAGPALELLDLVQDLEQAAELEAKHVVAEAIRQGADDRALQLLADHGKTSELRAAARIAIEQRQEAAK